MILIKKYVKLFTIHTLNIRFSIVKFFFKYTPFLIFVLVASCSHLSPIQDDVIARVGTLYLYRSDLKKMLSEEFLSTQDSIVKTRAFIDQWAHKQIILQQAKFNLPEAKILGIEELVDQYRTELFANTYKQYIANETLDTLINEQQLDSFLYENKSVFKLNAPLYQVRYIHLPIDNVDQNLIEFSFERYDSIDRHLLDSLSFQFTHFILNDSLWLKRNDLFSQVKFLTNENLDKYLKKSQFFKEKDAEGVYLLRFNDFLNKGDIPPKEIVFPTIKNVILNQRRVEFTKSFEYELLQNAIKSKTYEIY
jgi:hypothetical protein